MKAPLPTYIHLGLPKTATTTLQRHLFAQHSQLHYLGKTPGYGFPLAAAPVLSAFLFRTDYELLYEPGDIHLQGFEQQMSYAAENNLTTLLSKEGLAGGNAQKKRDQALLFKKTFGNCKIILFVREPESFIKSLYVQNLKGFQKKRKGQRRASWMKTLGEPPHYFDINEWMSAAWRSTNSPEQYLTYAETADIYVDVFGRENVRIFIFEEFVRNPETLVTGLCDYMGIDAEEGFNLVDGKRANDRLTTGYINRLKAIEKSFFLTWKFRTTTKSGERKKMLTPDDMSGEKIAPLLAEEWREKIHAVGDAQNRRLVSEWGLPLADYGYRI